MFGFLFGMLGTTVLYRVIGGKSAGGSLFGIIVSIIFYITVKNYIINNFSDYLIEMLIGYVFLTILLFKYSYKLNQADNIRNSIYIGIFVINILLVISVSLVFFNQIKHTPFSLIINCFNLFEINSNNFIEVICELIGYFLKALDIITRTLGFLFIQNLIIHILQKRHIRKLEEINI